MTGSSSSYIDPGTGMPVSSAACWLGTADAPYDLDGHVDQVTPELRRSLLATVTPGAVYPPANTTAQWFGDTYPGTLMTGVSKWLLHTTETGTWPSYGDGASAPQITYHPRLREWRQHNYLNRSGRALRDPSGTAVRENQDQVVQLEIVACSDLAFADRYGYLKVTQLSDDNLRDLADFAIFLHRYWGLKLTSASLWLPYPQSYGASAARMSGPTYDAFVGVLGHEHASGNDHGDPSTINVNRIIQLAQEGEVVSFDDAAKAWLTDVLVPLIRRDMTRLTSVQVIGAGTQYAVGPGIFWPVPNMTVLNAMRKIGMIAGTTVMLTQAELDAVKLAAETTHALRTDVPILSPSVREYARRLFDNPALTHLSSRYLLELAWARILEEISVNFAEDVTKIEVGLTELLARPTATVDTAALAAALLTGGLGGVSDEDLVRISESSADERDRRERTRLTEPDPGTPST